MVQVMAAEMAALGVPHPQTTALVVEQAGIQATAVTVREIIHQLRVLAAVAAADGTRGQIIFTLAAVVVLEY